MTDSFDFKGGKGPVPAHRHVNPDGSRGGWVADTARVSGDAQVFGHARVSGDARVFGHARVSGDARVFGHARVSGDARVFGDARVSGHAQVSGHARMSSPRDVLVFAGTGDGYQVVTCCRTETGHLITAGCWSGTVQDMRANLDDPEKHWPDADPMLRELWVAEYRLISTVCEARAVAWEIARVS